MTRPTHPDPARAHISLFGELCVEAGGQPVALARQAGRIVAFLAVGGPSDRATVAGTLWPDRADDAAAKDLRTALYRLGNVCAGLIVRAGSTLAVAPDVTSDLDDERLLIDRVADDPAALVRSAAGPRRRDVLDQWSDAWLEIEREVHRQRRLHALERASAELLARGETSLAIEAGLRAIAHDPLRESAHRCVVVAHLAEGNRHEAFRQEAILRRTLREAGLAPEPSFSIDDLTGPHAEPAVPEPTGAGRGTDRTSGPRRDRPPRRPRRHRHVVLRRPPSQRRTHSRSGAETISGAT